MPIRLEDPLVEPVTVWPQTDVKGDGGGGEGDGGGGDGLGGGGEGNGLGGGGEGGTGQVVWQTYFA